MARPGQKLAACVIAFAIAVVSTICTSAGCLLASAAPAAADAPVRACCAHRHVADQPAAPTSDHREGGKNCPLCYSPVVIAKAEKSQSTVDVAAAPLFFLAVFDLPTAADAQRLTAAPADQTAPTFLPPSTLFGLHCALLN